jgi:hypothetical protein
MNAYRLTVELGYYNEETDDYNYSEETFYIGHKTGINFDYIKRFIYRKCGDHYDTLDIVVERMSSNEKF